MAWSRSHNNCWRCSWRCLHQLYVRRPNTETKTRQRWWPKTKRCLRAGNLNYRKAKTTTVFSIRFTLKGKTIEFKTQFCKWITNHYTPPYVYTIIVAEAPEDDLFSNMSEELRETDTKQSPGTGKTIFSDFSFVTNSLSVIICCHGLNCVTPKFVCRSPNPQYDFHINMEYIQKMWKRINVAILEIMLF